MGDPIDFSLPMDSARAEQSYQLLKPEIDALAADAVVIPWLGVGDAARQAIALSQRAAEPALFARLSALGDEFDTAVIAKLNAAAWAILHAQAQYDDTSATGSKAQIPKALAEEASALRAFLFRVLDYNLGHIPEVAARLASIRSGSGHPDTASDLHREAVLWNQYESVLKNDGNNYDPNAPVRARELSAQITDELAMGQAAKAAEWANQRARCFTLLVRWYEDVHTTCAWLHRANPDQAALFPALMNTTQRSRTV